MKNKNTFAWIFTLMLLFWLALTGFSLEELIAGCAAALIAAAMSYRLFSFDKTYPKRFAWLIAYIPYYFYAEMVSHAQVIRMVLTGRINPGIVEIDNPHQSDYGTFALANSITMTPGTLTLETRPGKLYIHWIKVGKDRKSITSGFERFLKKVWP
jgi:multicomponent Na+:H+ antiporter subunit E